MISAMIRQWSRARVFGFVAPIAEAEKTGVVAECGGDLRFSARLRGVTTHAGDHRERAVASAIAMRASSIASSSTGRKSPIARIANRELRRVHADRDAARAGVDVVSRQPALALSSSLRASVNASGCAGMTWPSRRCSRTLISAAQNLPSRASNFVGLPSSGPSCSTQSATHLEHLSTRHFRRREQRAHARRVAEQRVRSLDARELRLDAESLAEPRRRASRTDSVRCP